MHNFFHSFILLSIFVHMLEHSPWRDFGTSGPGHPSWFPHHFRLDVEWAGASRDLTFLFFNGIHCSFGEVILVGVVEVWTAIVSAFFDIVDLGIGPSTLAWWRRAWLASFADWWRAGGGSGTHRRMNWARLDHAVCMSRKELKGKLLLELSEHVTSVDLFNFLGRVLRNKVLDVHKATTDSHK